MPTEGQTSNDRGAAIIPGHDAELPTTARTWPPYARVGQSTGVIDEIRELLSRHLPGHEVRSIAWLGQGWENVAYEVNGELLVRASKEADPARRGELTRREADLLVVVAEWSTLPIPEPIFVDAEAGVLAYRKLPGLPLSAHPVAEPARLATALGEFLNRLQRAPLEKMAQLVPRDAEPMHQWRADAEQSYRQIAEQLPTAARRLVEDFLGRPPPPGPRTLAFCHNDLGAEHLLVDPASSTITGVIDWSDAAIADPAYDLGLIYRDLGPEIFDLTLARYDGHRDDTDRERAVFYARCALLEDIAYGLRTGERHYAEEGLAHLARTFA